MSSACTARNVQTPLVPPAQKNMNQNGAPIDQDLRRLVKTFAEDVGPNGQAAWTKLQSYPRTELTNSLLGLQSSATKDDPQRYAISFTLANLDYEYQNNVKVLTSALTARPKPNEYADTATVMLGRLIKRGDKNLLKVLFSVARLADASLGEALSDTFASELRTDPKGFLTQLNGESTETRSTVYRLLESGPLTSAEIKDLSTQLKSLTRDRSVSRTATEMLASPFFRKD
jgi:hypothetical protein